MIQTVPWGPFPSESLALGEAAGPHRTSHFPERLERSVSWFGGVPFPAPPRPVAAAWLSPGRSWRLLADGQRDGGLSPGQADGQARRPARRDHPQEDVPARCGVAAPTETRSCPPRRSGASSGPWA